MKRVDTTTPSRELTDSGSPSRLGTCQVRPPTAGTRTRSRSKGVSCVGPRFWRMTAATSRGSRLSAGSRAGWTAGDRTDVFSLGLVVMCLSKVLRLPHAQRDNLADGDGGQELRIERIEPAVTGGFAYRGAQESRIGFRCHSYLRFESICLERTQ